MLIFGGVKTPFVLSATFAAGDGIDAEVTEEFDTFGAAQAAVEKLVLAHGEHLDDYTIDLKRSDLQAGEFVKFDFVEVIDLANPDRRRTRTENITKGVWSISWRKPEQTTQDLAEVALEEIRAREAAGIA